MIQSERWMSNGLLATPLSLSSRVALLSRYPTRYFSFGDVGAPPLVILPGLTGGMDLGLPLARRLSEQFRVFILQPRCEDSPYDLSQLTSIAHLAHDVLEFQSELGLERPLLLGLCFGGLVALQAAALQPARYSGVIVQGVRPSYPISPYHEAAKQVLAVQHTPHQFISNQFYEGLFGTTWVLPELRQLVAQCCSRTEQGVLARRLELCEQFDAESLVDGLRQVPLLTQTAANDVIVSPEAWKPWRRVLPRMTLQRVEGAGHFAFLTHVQQMAEQVERFAGRRLGVAVKLPT